MSEPEIVLPASSPPKTVQEAVDCLLAGANPEAISLLRKMSVDDMIAGLHFTLGQTIRNHFGLWDYNVLLMLDCGTIHPDDASGVILRALHERLRKWPYNPADGFPEKYYPGM